jgi:hypothetical protein
MVFFGLILGRFTHSWHSKNCWLSATSNVVQFINTEEDARAVSWFRLIQFSSSLCDLWVPISMQQQRDAWFTCYDNLRNGRLSKQSSWGRFLAVTCEYHFTQKWRALFQSPHLTDVQTNWPHKISLACVIEIKPRYLLKKQSRCYVTV